MHECLAVCRLLGLVHMFSHNNIENVHVENQATDDFNVKNQATDDFNVKNRAPLNECQIFLPL